MSPRRIVLVPGFWLGSWAWEQVEQRLRELGHPTRALTLPGLDPADPDRATRTPEEQARALLDALAEPSVLVAHSGANIPATIAMDRRPDLVQRMVWVDSGPVGDGFLMAPEAPTDLIDHPLPAFDVLGQGASLAGLDDEALDEFRRRAVPEPGPVLTTRVTLGNDARYAVPTTVVCTSLPSAQLKALADDGHPMMAETSRYAATDMVDLPTGHWPMWSRPRELAEIISAAAEN